MSQGTEERRRILILDDDPGVGRTIAFMSERLGLQSRSVDNAHDFFEALHQWRPAYVVIDLIMPDMDGVEVMRQLARLRSTVAIIISSGVGTRVLDAAERAAAEHRLNVLGVLSKPFTRQKLQDILGQVSRMPQHPMDGDQDVASPFGLPDITEQALLEAIEQDQFTMVYQPKIACRDNSVVGFEALVRWQHPEGGLIRPDHFIPLAESLDMIDPLTDVVIEQSLGWVATMQYLPSLSLAINLSAKTLVNHEFADRLAARCLEKSVKPGRITLEMTETAAMEDSVMALELLTRLRMKGFHVAIDDFGTGYSSMVQLARLPFSELKVDKSFVMTAASSEEARTIIHSTVELGHSLGLDVVAEGVEDGNALAFLKTIGCDYAQGYYIARPMPTHHVTGWLNARQAN
ncbi:EAL domain-containing response regulator [Aidingimonas halophila]|uniref:EAL domain, c-di-GMP-specific phosphodiesterase class I (Or its enzymatically inactive variant) n=1 Tax=Aidingimonas halophila TaxID=574349 RepID=A0A1H3D0S8_9GAMM|nr:EAL domain-containing response regulator [Aidingimonas halophila]GHC30706.1 transcriptional regulator [Aidingimonas halophila]SDX59997.1 EAL domain, c-di-GMP-specific phosphodiesterase class I (or its enzymatically inactive variant) [Aidingimonas halophila]